MRVVVDDDDLVEKVIYEECISIVFIYPLALILTLYCNRKLDLMKKNAIANIENDINRQQQLYFEALRKSWM